jgi:ABC-type polysaccharide/polyol phosphate export permease
LPQRNCRRRRDCRFLAAVLGRFFRVVAVAVVVIILVVWFRPHGWRSGFAQAPLHWHMRCLASGLLMAVIFALIYLSVLPAPQALAVAASGLAGGGGGDESRIRLLVA